MTATLKAPGTYEVTDSDPAWEAIVHDCKLLGAVVIQGPDGAPYRLLPQPRNTNAGRTITALPDFEARFRQLWPEGQALDEAESVELDKLIEGE